jgi:hypothetical protein
VARHVKGLEITRLNLELDAPDARPDRFLQDVEDVTVEGWSLKK